MCYGAEASWVPAVIAAVTSAAGTYSAAKSNKLQIESQADAARQDRLRQAGMQEEADAALRDEVTKFAPENTSKQLDLAAATRSAAAAPPQQAPAQYQSAPTSAPVEVKGDLDRRLGDVTSKATEEAGRRARLAAYGDLSLAQNMQLGRLGENFRQLQSRSRGSTNVMRAESGLPSTAAQGWANRSDLANTIGQIGSLYAMYGGKKSGGLGYGEASNPSALGQSTGPY